MDSSVLIMNPDRSFLIFAVVFSTLVYTFELYLQIRQHSHFSIQKRKKSIESIVTDEEFQKMQNYSRDKSRFAFFKNAFDHIQTVSVWLLFILPFLWKFSGNRLRSFGYDEDSEIIQSLVFVLILSIPLQFIQIPFDLYFTFIIEEKHGFNKQSLKLFFTDQIKGLFISSIIGLPVLAILLFIIKRFGEMFPIYVWGFLFVFKIVMVTIYPIFIQPCFNKTEQLPIGTLRTKIEDLAGKLEFPLSKLYSVDGSRRSAHSNAYIYGFFKNKRIVLFDTLIEQCTEEQIVAVLGHELGHWKLNHVLKMLFFSEVQTIVMFSLFQKVMYTRELYQSFGFDEEMPVLIGLVLFSIMYSPITHVISFIINWYSRRNEFAADDFSKSLGYAKVLKEALIVMQKKNLGNIVPDSWYSTYHYSHPPIVERLSALSKTKSE
uniref:CAAX prenyl protease n=1 Tax=Hirondellea gigas TaxID=1518452 RepID=A0A6A7G600_9CRUS